ncbi:MAG: ParA family protein [Bacteroidota bacterium]
MAVLTFCNHKGGTGKTTSVINVAAALGLAGYKTVVIDLDPQSFLTRTLGVDEPPEQASSLRLFENGASLRDAPLLSMKNFDLLPASSGLTKAMRRLNRPTDVFWVKEALDAGHDYDVVILDTAAAVTVFSLNALVSTTQVLIPATPEYQPILGAEQTFQTVMLVKAKLNPELPKPSFLLTRVDARKRVHAHYARYLRRKYDQCVLDQVVRTSTSLVQTNHDGHTVFERAPRARGAKDYLNVTRELVRRMGLPRKLDPQKQEQNGRRPDARRVASTT